MPHARANLFYRTKPAPLIKLTSPLCKPDLHLAQLLQILKAVLANVLAFEHCDTACIRAECAGGRILLQYDLIVLNVDFDTVAYANVKSSSKLYRKHNSAQLVYLSYNAG